MTSRRALRDGRTLTLSKSSWCPMRSEVRSIASSPRRAAATLMEILFLVAVPFCLPAAGQLQTWDLVVRTRGVLPGTERRSFTIANGVRAVTVRFKFQTDEVPGGYFGSQFNDSYRVQIKGSSGRQSVDESDMNRLGF